MATDEGKLPGLSLLDPAEAEAEDLLMVSRPGVRSYRVRWADLPGAAYPPLDDEDGNVVDPTKPYGLVERYGAVGDADDDGLGTDDATALNNAAAACAAMGLPMLFTPGKRYLTSTGIIHSGSSLRMYGPEATIVQGGNVNALKLTGGWEATVAVSALATVEYDVSTGASATTAVTRVTVASVPASCTVGAIVKITANDYYSDARSPSGGNGSRVGQFARVAAVSGLNVYLHGVLRDQSLYTTNIKLSVLKDVTFSIEGLSFDTCTAGDAADWNAGLVEVIAARDVLFRELTAVKGYGPFLKPYGVKGYRAENIHGKDLRNELVKERYGYVLLSSTSEDGVVVNLTGTRCRHVYTTSQDPTADQSTSYHKYGKTVGDRIYGGQAIDCTNSGFDTHLGAYDVEFHGCRVSTTVTGSDTVNGALGAGYNARGKKIRFFDCVADHCEYFAQVIDEDPVGGTDEIEFHNCAGYGLSERVIMTLSTARVLINGGSFTLTDQGLSGLQIDGGTRMTIRGGAKFVISSPGGESGVTLDEASSLIINDAEFDLSGMAGSPRFSLFLDANSSVEIRRGGLRVLRGASATLGTAFSASSTGFGSFTCTDRGRVLFDKKPSVITSANVATAKYSWLLTDGSDASAFVSMSLTANDQVPATSVLTDDLVVVTINSSAGGSSVANTADGNWNLGALANGAFVGQELILRNRSTSFGHFTLRASLATYNTSMPSDVRCGEFDSIRLRWGGAATGWVLLAVERLRHMAMHHSVRTSLLADANVSFSAASDAFHQEGATVLTATRTLTLNKSRAVIGDRLYVKHTAASGGNTWDVKTEAGTTLKSIATGQWADFFYNGSAWELDRFGSL